MFPPSASQLALCVRVSTALQRGRLPMSRRGCLRPFVVMARHFTPAPVVVWSCASLTAVYLGLSDSAIYREVPRNMTMLPSFLKRFVWRVLLASLLRQACSLAKLVPCPLAPPFCLPACRCEVQRRSA